MYVSRELTCAGTVGFASDEPVIGYEEFPWVAVPRARSLDLTCGAEINSTHSLEPSPTNSLPDADKAAMEAQSRSSDT